MIRRFVGRSPQGGQGKLFTSYLKPVKECAACGEDLGHIRADDGPVWATILLVGHILAPFLLGILPNYPWSDWVLIAAIVPTALTLTLVLLPRMKGVFIGIIWRSGCVGSEK